MFEVFTPCWGLFKDDHKIGMRKNIYIYINTHPIGTGFEG
jgi:hypothetical protein